jgi:pimeloyl-ACP methyl ester carboxylesterase
MGRSLAPMVRGVFWNEMKGRAAGASQPAGGAAQFTRALLAAMATTPNERYKLHLVGHSAGAIYLGALVEKVLASVLPGSNATLDSIDLMAPAITIARARTAFGATGLPPQKVRVHMLATRDEERDNIHIYPSSLLTYVADCLESASARVPVLGLRKDYDQAALTFATASAATTSKRHGEFDDPGHEVEEVLEDARIG